MKQSLLKLTIFSVLCLFSTLNIHSQVGTSYYIKDVISVNARLFNIGKSDITAEAKIFTNKSFINAELDLLFRFAQSEFHQLGIGFGINLGLDYENSQYLIPVVLEVYPFKNFQRASFLLELAAGMETEVDDYFIRGLAGIRYTLGKPKRKSLD